MARLAIPSHPNRVFKDEAWADAAEQVHGYRSIGEHSNRPAAYANMWAFAILLKEDATDGERVMYQRIVNIGEPFVAAEVVRLGGVLCAIGFYPEPDNDAPMPSRRGNSHWFASLPNR